MPPAQLQPPLQYAEESSQSVISRHARPSGAVAIAVVPTYNERENIIHLLPELRRVREELALDGWDFRVLVVDDNSPDGTGEVVREFQRGNDFVQLLLRTEKDGLGRAYVAGMKQAIVKGAYAVIEMDADLSHNPSQIASLLQALDAGSDVAIGSRYVPGGSSPGHDWRRKTISRGANLLVQGVVGMKDVRDCTSGFRAIKATHLQRVRLDALDSKGYFFQIGLLEALMRTGAAVHEHPICFTDRASGKSKLALRDIVEFFIRTWQLRLRRSFSG